MGGCRVSVWQLGCLNWLAAWVARRLDRLVRCEERVLELTSADHTVMLHIRHHLLLVLVLLYGIDGQLMHQVREISWCVRRYAWHLRTKEVALTLQPLGWSLSHEACRLWCRALLLPSRLS